MMVWIRSFRSGWKGLRASRFKVPRRDSSNLWFYQIKCQSIFAASRRFVFQNDLESPIPQQDLETAPIIQWIFTANHGCDDDYCIVIPWCVSPLPPRHRYASHTVFVFVKIGSRRRSRLKRQKIKSRKKKSAYSEHENLRRNYRSLKARNSGWKIRNACEDKWELSTF